MPKNEIFAKFAKQLQADGMPLSAGVLYNNMHNQEFFDKVFETVTADGLQMDKQTFAKKLGLGTISSDYKTLGIDGKPNQLTTKTTQSPTIQTKSTVQPKPTAVIPNFNIPSIVKDIKTDERIINSPLPSATSIKTVPVKPSTFDVSKIEEKAKAQEQAFKGGYYPTEKEQPLIFEGKQYNTEIRPIEREELPKYDKLFVEDILGDNDNFTDKYNSTYLEKSDIEYQKNQANQSGYNEFNYKKSNYDRQFKALKEYESKLNQSISNKFNTSDILTDIQKENELLNSELSKLETLKNTNAPLLKTIESDIALLNNRYQNGQINENAYRAEFASLKAKYETIGQEINKKTSEIQEQQRQFQSKYSDKEVSDLLRVKQKQFEVAKESANIINDPKFAKIKEGEAKTNEAQKVADNKKKLEIQLQNKEIDFNKYATEVEKLDKAKNVQINTQAFIADKTWNLFSQILTLPRTISGNFENNYGFVDKVADWANHMSEVKQKKNPYSSDIQVNTFQKFAQVGDLRVLLDEKGNAYDVRDNRYFSIDQQQAEQALKQYNENKKGYKIYNQTNADAFTKNALSTIADVGILILGTKGLGSLAGGGKLASTLIGGGVAFTQIQNDLYKQGIESGLNPQDASQFATKVGTSISLISFINPTEYKLAGAGGLFPSIRQNVISQADVALINSGEMSITQIASKYAKGIAKNIVGENFEELIGEPLAQDLISNLYESRIANDGEGFTKQFDPISKQGLETLLLTSVVAIPFGAAEVTQEMPHYQAMAMQSAIENPQAYIDVLKKRKEMGIIDDAQMNAQLLQMQEISEVYNSISSEIKDERKPELAGLLAKKNVALNKIKDIKDDVLSNNWKSKLEKINEDIQAIVDNVATKNNMVASDGIESDVVESDEVESKTKQKEPIKVFSDFDNTLFDPTTQTLTPLGEEMKLRIEAGEDIEIVTARENTKENIDLIVSQTGIDPSKITLGLTPEMKAEKVGEFEGKSQFIDDNAENIQAVSGLNNENVEILPVISKKQALRDKLTAKAKANEDAKKIKKEELAKSEAVPLNEKGDVDLPKIAADAIDVKVEEIKVEEKKPIQISDTLTNEEFLDFIDNDTISVERLENIANKQANGVKLTPKEETIKKAKQAEIQSIIDGKKIEKINQGMPEISADELNNIFDSGKVSDDRANDIAKKLINGEELSKREKSVFENNTKVINKKVDELKPLLEKRIVEEVKGEVAREIGEFTKDGITYKRQSKKTKNKGKKDIVKFAEKVSMPFTYQLMEADDVQGSHINGNRNPLHFIKEAQPKERNDAGSNLASNRIAENMNFDEVSQSSNAYSGAPIVNEFGEVIQGNNRIEGIKKHYKSNQEKYKNDLIENAEQFGLTKEQVIGMKSPILVRTLSVTDEKAIELGNYDAKDIETGGKRGLDPIAITSRMSDSDKANLAELATRDDEKTINSNINKYKDEIINTIKKYLNTAQMVSLTNSVGELTVESVKGIEEIVKQLLFDKSPEVLMQSELFSSVAKKGLTKSLQFIFGVPTENQLIQETQKAISLGYLFIKSNNADFSLFLLQKDLFSNVSPNEQFTKLEIELAKILLNAKKESDVFLFYKEYKNEVLGKEGDMFSDPTKPKTKQEIINERYGKESKETNKGETDKGKGDKGEGAGSEVGNNAKNTKKQTVEQSPKETPKAGSVVGGDVEAKKADIERRKQALRDLMKATGDDIFMLGVEDGTFMGEALLNMNENGDVILTRYADSEEGLTKGKGKTKNLKDIAGQFGGEQIATSGIEGGAASFVNGVVGEYHIPLQELIDLIKSEDVVFAGLGNKEFVLSPHIADKYLTKINGKQINAKYDAELKALEQSQAGSGGVGDVKDTFENREAIESNLKDLGDNVYYHGSDDISYLNSKEDLNTAENTKNAESKYLNLSPKASVAVSYSIRQQKIGKKSGVAAFKLKGKGYTMKAADIKTLKSNADYEAFYDKKKSEGYDYVKVPQDANNIVVLNNNAIEYVGKKLNIEAVEQSPKETTKAVISEIKTKNLTHVRGKDMGENQSLGTFVSTEENNRYETPTQKAEKVDVEIENPLVVVDDYGLLSRRQEILNENRGKFTAEDSNDYEDLPNRKLTVDDLNDDGIKKLATLTTEILKAQGYDSIYFRESDTQEGELVVFDKKKVTFKENNKEVTNVAKITPVTQNGKTIIDENGNLTDELSNQFEQLKKDNNLNGLDNLYSTVKIFLNGIAQSKGENTVEQFQKLKKEIEEHAKELKKEEQKPRNNNQENLFSTSTVDKEKTTAKQKKEVSKIIEFFNKMFGFNGFASFDEFADKLKSLGYDSLQAMVEAKNNGLIAIHNINPISILNANELGGIAMPSIAITDVNNPFDSFGSISLLASKNLIDPKQSSDNKVFGSDVYSARYPSITYVRKGYTDTSLFNDKERESIASNSINNDIENGGIDRMSSNTYIKQMYLISKGIKVPYVSKGKEISSKYINKFKRLGLDKLQHWQLKESKEFNDLALEYFKENNSQETINAGRFIVDGLLNQNLVNNYAYTFISDSKEFTDEYETSKKVDKLIEKDIDGYNKFAKQQYEKAKVEEKIFKGYTYNGTRKYVPHTLANVIKEMKADGVRNGEKFGYGAGSVRATITKQFKSVQDIINSKDKLVANSEFEKVKDEINKELIELLEEIKPYYKYEGGFGYYDDAGTQLNVVANRGQSEAFNKMPIELQNKVAEFLNKLQNAPTQYFEAKITRPVGISEFDTAIVPKGTANYVLQILKDAGLNIVEYRSKEDRQEKIKQQSEKRQLQFLKTPSGKVLGFVSDGKIYLNPNALTAETAFHELAHVQQAFIKIAAQKGDKIAQAVRSRWDRLMQENDVLGQIAKFDKGVKKPAQFSIKMSDGSTQQVKKINTEVVNGFYSPLEKTLAEFKGEKLPAKQWLDKFGKGEESKWTGLTKFLESKLGQSISKSEIQQYLKDNRIEIVEVVKGGDIAESEIDILLADEVGEGMTRDEAREYLSREDDNEQPKFSQYQLEGEKENYREVLVTMPNKKTAFDEINKAFGFYDKALEVYGKEFDDLTNSELESLRQDLKTNNPKKYSDFTKALEIGRTNESVKFKSTHFDEPNILVHLRMSERVDADGNKVLHLSEIQSDWGQEGKKKGFSSSFDKNKVEKVREDSNVWVVYFEDGTFLDIAKSEAKNENEAKSLAEKSDTHRHKGHDKKTANAPFVTDTNNWVKLGLKVALKEAVKSGATKITWETGETQNDRYDLSKQVDEVKVLPQYGGSKMTYAVQGFKDGEMTTTMAANSIAELEGIVGKDLAKKVEEKGEYEGELSFKGNDLKVGGKGMIGFYGSPTEGKIGIVGGVAEKLFGQKVSPAEIFLQDKLMSGYDVTIKDKNGLVTTHNFDSKAQGLAWMSKQNGIEFISDKAEGKDYTTQHSVEITPQLKATVEQGQALFSTKGGKETPRIIKLKDGKDTHEIDLSSSVYDQAENESDADYQERIMNEVWAYITAPENVKKWNEANKKGGSKLWNFVQAVANFFKEKLGLKDLTIDQILNSSLKDLIEHTANGLMKGEWFDMQNENGMDWVETPIGEQQLNKPVVAFQISDNQDTLPFETNDKTNATKQNIQDKFPDAIVVQSESELPLPIQNEIKQQRAEGKVKGIFYNGKVYMVASNIKTIGEATGTYRHEKLGHKGAIEHLKDKLDAYATRIIDNAKGEQLGKLKQLAKRYGLPTDLTKLTPKQKSDLGQEYVAMISENKSKYPKLWNDLVSFVREAIRMFGIKLQVTDTEIQALIGKVEKNIKTKNDLSKNGKSQFQLNTPQAELNNIKEKAIADGTFMKAPNGKTTNLNENQWLQVRTKSFKEWFGNWENDPKNASKVIDVNGEPMVVYHGTSKKINVFDKNTIGKNFKQSELGFYFTNEKTINDSGIYGTTAEEYARNSASNGYGQYAENEFENIIEVFLSIQSPLVLNDDGWYSAVTYLDKNTSAIKRWLKNEDGVIATLLGEEGEMKDGQQQKALVVFEPNQIKSATDNVGTFDAGDNDIRFQLSNDATQKFDPKNKTHIEYSDMLNEYVDILIEEGEIPTLESFKEFIDEDTFNEIVNELGIPFIEGKFNTPFVENLKLEKLSKEQKDSPLVKRGQATLGEDARQEFDEIGRTYTADKWKEIEPQVDAFVQKVLGSRNFTESVKEIMQWMKEMPMGNYLNEDGIATAHTMILNKLTMHSYTLDKELFKEIFKFAKIRGTSFGQAIAAYAEASTPESLFNNAIGDLEIEKEEILNTVQPSGQTLKQELDLILQQISIKADEITEVLSAIESQTKSVATKTRNKGTKTSTTKSQSNFMPKSKEAKAKAKIKIDDAKARLAKWLEKQNTLNFAYDPKADLKAHQELLDISKDFILGFLEYGYASVLKIKENLQSALGKNVNVDDFWHEVYDDEVRAKVKDLEKEQIVNAIVNAIKEPGETKETTAITQISRILAGMAKNKNKSEKSNVPIDEQVRLLFENKDIASESLKEALRVGIEQINNNPNLSDEQKLERTKTLQDMASNFTVVPEAVSRKAIQSGLKSIEETIESIAKKHYLDAEDAKQNLIDKLVLNANLSHEDAVQYADILSKELEKQVSEKKAKLLDKLLNPTTKKAGNKKEIEKIIDAINLGALSSDEFASLFAKKFGFRSITPQQIQFLQNTISIMFQQKGIMKRRIARTLADYIASLKPLDARNVGMLIQEIFYQHALGGINTVALNIPTGSTLSVMANMIPVIAKNPMLFIKANLAYNRAGLGGTGIKAFIDTLQTGFNDVDNFVDEKNFLTSGSRYHKFLLSWGFKDPQNFITSVLYKLPMHIGYFASAFDNLINHRGGEILNYMHEYQSTDKSYLTIKEIHKQVETKMGYDDSKIYSSTVNDEILDMEANGLTIPTGYKEQRVKELMVETRNRDIQQQAYRLIRSYGLMGKPDGISGAIYRAIAPAGIINDKDSNLTAIVKTIASVTLLPFLRISFASMGMLASGIPVIGMGLGSYKLEKNEQTKRNEFSFKSAEEIKQLAGMQAMTIGALIFGFMEMFDMEDDENGNTVLSLNKNRSFDITGTNISFFDQDKMQLDKGNYLPLSIRFRKNNGTFGKLHEVGRYMPPIVAVMSILGNLRDKIEIQSLSKLDEEGQIKTTYANKEMVFESLMSIYGGLTVTSYNSLAQFVGKSADIIGYKNKSPQIQSDKKIEDTKKLLFNTAARPLKTLALPNIYRDITKNTEALLGSQKTMDSQYKNILKDFYGLDHLTNHLEVDIFGNKVMQTASFGEDDRYNLPEWKLLRERNIVFDTPYFYKTAKFDGEKKNITNEQRLKLNDKASIAFGNYIRENIEYLKGLNQVELIQEFDNYADHAKRDITSLDFNEAIK